jgi:RNA polymerase sigma-70 factor (ECF subfamily)
MGRSTWTLRCSSRSCLKTATVAGVSPTATRAPSHATEDAQLIDALVRGDEAAFAALFDASSSWMLRVARIYVPPREAAEEAVQDAWVNVLRSLDRFELSADTRNALLDAFRRSRSGR